MTKLWYRFLSLLSAAFFNINKVCTPLLCLTSKLHHWGHANLPTVQHWIDIWQLCSWHYIQLTRKFQSLSYDLKPLSADQSQHFLQYFEFKEIENVNPNFFRNNWHLESIFHFQTIFSFFHTFRGVFTYANYFFHFQKFIVLISHFRIKIVWTFEVFKLEFLLFITILYVLLVKFKVCFGSKRNVR